MSDHRVRATGCVRNVLCACLLASATLLLLVYFDAPAPSTQAEAQTASIAPPPSAAFLTDDECRHYPRSTHYLIALYVSRDDQVIRDRSIRFEFAGIAASVADNQVDLGRGYRLVPIRKVTKPGPFIVWVRTGNEVMTDSRERAFFRGDMSDLVGAHSSSLGLRCE